MEKSAQTKCKIYTHAGISAKGDRDRDRDSWRWRVKRTGSLPYNLAVYTVYL